MFMKLFTRSIYFFLFFIAAYTASAQCPAPITVNNDAGKCGAVVNYTVTAPSDTITFNYTGASQTWVVPQGVYSITAVVYGAKGANSYASGGNGGLMKATFAVTPGQTLTIFVGGQGSGVNGGFNGGGTGGGVLSGFSDIGTGGGGASDIRTNTAALSDRIIVAGGGGGSQIEVGASGCASGGGGGGYNGSYGGCFGGTGGSQTAAGYNGDTYFPGGYGSFGQGGNGSDGGGGGGGGWYGGGGGESDPGGGGSGYIAPSGTVITTQNGVQNGNGLVYILIPSASTNQTAGLRSGSLFPVGTTTNNFTFKDYQDKASYCSFTVTVADKESPVPVVSSLPAITSMCAVTVSAPKATDNCSGSITGTTTDPVTYSAPGTYTIHWTYTDKAGNVSTQTQTVTITQSPTISSQTNVDCNGNTTGSVTVTASSGNAPYSYSINGTDFSNTSGTFSSLAAGNYTITVKDANGCTATVPVTITQPTSLSGSISSQTNVYCNGNSNGSVTVAGSGGTKPYFYYKYGTDGLTYYTTSGIFNSLAAGNYTITVRDANGCTAPIPVTITQPSLLSDSITAQTNASCYGSSNGTVTVTSNGEIGRAHV